MDYKKLIIRGISYSQTQSGAYVLLLEDEETSVKLPVVIGNFEAQSISLGIEKDIHPPRPLTHDLFSKFVQSTQHSVSCVMIHQIVDGVFFSNISFINEISGEELILDARTSDAVAMAVRFEAPIYTTGQVLDEAGILLELEEARTNGPLSVKSSQSVHGLSHLSMEELQGRLESAVKDEDFDKALFIQEEIKKRKKMSDSS
ncbi:MAG: bifunctional nuclease family protein [Bergeyella sp.]|nr:bifunctional nuclease family protein [Bergeyella sp.]